VQLMEEIVHVDVLVTVEPKPGGDGAAKLTTAHHQSVQDAVARVLAAARGTVERAQLRHEIAAALAALPPAIQLVEDGGVALNAEYEETGRLLNTTETAALEPHQVPVARDVRLTMPGALG